jgi:hypothetical protein
MPRFAITERAGPFVAAHRNTGVGTVLVLSERQAEHELRLGTLVALSAETGGSPGPSVEVMSLSAQEAAEGYASPVAPETEADHFPTRKPKRSGT